MVTESQSASLRALEADETTRPFAALATRALVFNDEATANNFVTAVLQATSKIRDAWTTGAEGANQGEALLLAHMLFLLRAVALRFPSLAKIVPAPVTTAPVPTPTPAAASRRPRRRRKTRGGNFERKPNERRPA